MGAKIEIYQNNIEDYAEKPIKKGMNLQKVFESTQLTNINEVYGLIFQPNNWNVFHMACWYNNTPLLQDLLTNAAFKREYMNMPDINKEPPIAICCFVDSVECLKLLLEAGALRTFDGRTNEYRVGLNLNRLCVLHDAVKCFSYLNPDLTIESPELDECYDLAKKNGSDFIVPLFEEMKIYDELDSVIDVQQEEMMESIQF